MPWIYPERWAGLRHPWVRAELLAHLAELADPTQTAGWLAPSASEAVGIDEMFHFLFDDHDYADDPAGEIGLSLLDAIEAGTLITVTAALSAILDTDHAGDDAYFLAHPLWPDVQRTAEVALARLSEAGEPVWTP